MSNNIKWTSGDFRSMQLICYEKKMSKNIKWISDDFKKHIVYLLRNKIEACTNNDLESSYTYFTL